MKIEICHASEVIADRWQIVDEFSANKLLPQREFVKLYNDYLESPGFEWSKGLCVRVRGYHNIHYAGIFDGDRCVDVSEYSEVMKRHPWEYDPKAVNRSDFISRWMMCDHPSRMAFAVRNVVQGKYILETVIKVSKRIQFYLDGDIFSRALKLSQGVRDDGLVNEANRLDDIRYDNFLYWLAKSGAHAVFAANSPLPDSMITHGLTSLSCMNMFCDVRKQRIDIPAILRETVPFYELALSVVR